MPFYTSVAGLLSYGRLEDTRTLESRALCSATANPCVSKLYIFNLWNSTQNCAACLGS